jgi:predicted Holliday junction resolvase-like endonuclease
MSFGDFAKAFLNYIRLEDQIGGYCPHCHELFRLSEVELFFIPDRKDDFLAELRKKERDIEQNLQQQITLARQDAIKRSRSTLMGKLFETVRPYLPGFAYNPNDLRAIWNPVDFVCFNGLAVNRSVESITFIEIKTGKSFLTSVERSIRDAVKNNRISFETVSTLGISTDELPGTTPVGTSNP